MITCLDYCVRVCTLKQNVLHGRTIHLDDVTIVQVAHYKSYLCIALHKYWLLFGGLIMHGWCKLFSKSGTCRSVETLTTFGLTHVKRKHHRQKFSNNLLAFCQGCKHNVLPHTFSDMNSIMTMACVGSNMLNYLTSLSYCVMLSQLRFFFFFFSQVN